MHPVSSPNEPAPRVLPGLDLAVLDGDALRVTTGRAAPNSWWLLVTEPAGAPESADAGDAQDPPDDAPAELVAVVAAVERSAADTRRPPSQVLATASDDLRKTVTGGCVHALFVRIELDTCGAWMTLANAGALRPIVLRRAGWTDMRGHVAEPLGSEGDAGYAVDRAGLGPGDRLAVVAAARQERVRWDGTRVGDEALPDLLVHHCADESRALVAAIAALGGGPGADARTTRGPVVVAGVPGDLGEDPRERVALATGVPAGDLHLPGYPLGDLQPDLWAVPPAPPREARLHLTADLMRLAEVRGLLRRLLASWRLDARLEGSDVELLATEIATNAIRHGREPVTVIVRYVGRAVRVEVGDGSPEMPVRMHPDLDQEGGRGVLLVDTLASRWGVIPTLAGKRVWFEIPVAES